MLFLLDEVYSTEVRIGSTERRGKERTEWSACDGNWFGPCGMIEAKGEEAKQWGLAALAPGPIELRSLM